MSSRLPALLWTGRLEALTWILLLAVAVPLKHLAGEPLAVRCIGPVHGLAFLAYWWLLIEEGSARGWSNRQLLRLGLGTLLPGGTLANEKKLQG